MSEMSCHSDHSICHTLSRDLRRDYELFIKNKLDLINFIKIYDDLINEGIICGNIREIMELGYRWCLAKGYVGEGGIIKKYLDIERCTCGNCSNNLFDYLDFITILHYVVNKKSFSCLYI